MRSVVDLNISVFLVHLYMCLEFSHFNFSFGTKSSLDLLDPIHNPSNVKFGFLVKSAQTTNHTSPSPAPHCSAKTDRGEGQGRQDGEAQDRI